MVEVSVGCPAWSTVSRGIGVSKVTAAASGWTCDGLRKMDGDGTGKVWKQSVRSVGAAALKATLIFGAPRPPPSDVSVVCASLCVFLSSYAKTP